MIYLTGVLISAEFWIGLFVGIFLGNAVKKILKWLWNFIPGVPKF